MKYNAKLKLLYVLAAVLLVLIGLAVILGLTAGKEAPPDPTQLPTVAPTTRPATEAPTLSVTEVPTAGPTEDPTAAATTEPTENPTVKPTEKPVAPTKAPDPPAPKPTAPPVTVVDPPAPPQPTEPPMISFPYAIPGSDLVVQKVISYDGIFLEDGSDREISGVTVMFLANQGTSGVEYADITLTRENGTQLQFKATAVPAGTSIVVMELSAAPYEESRYSACTADVAVMDTFEMSESMVKVEENEDGSLNVTNLTENTIPCIRIFYKFSMERSRVYVGGITYTAKLVELKAGETQRIAPSHFAFGSSEVVMVRTYDTAE